MSVSGRSPKLRRQLAEARQPLLPKRSLLHRRLHSAARLRVVSAIVEAALFGQGSDIVERFLDSVLGLPEPYFAHPRVVDQHPTGWERDELTARSRVPSGAIATLLPGH
jgi:hypothetical protein